MLPAAHICKARAWPPLQACRQAQWCSRLGSRPCWHNAPLALCYLSPVRCGRRCLPHLCAAAELVAAEGVEKTLSLVMTSGLVKRQNFLDALAERLEPPLKKARRCSSVVPAMQPASRAGLLCLQVAAGSGLGKRQRTMFVV